MTELDDHLPYRYGRSTSNRRRSTANARGDTHDSTTMSRPPGSSYSASLADRPADVLQRPVNVLCDEVMKEEHAQNRVE